MEDYSFTFIVESVHLFLSTSRSKHLCELCIDSYILAYCICYVTLCWQLSMRYTCYKLKATAETSSSFVLLQCFYFELLLYELTLMQDLLMLVLKYYSWKVFAIWFTCLLMSLLLFWSLHSLHMFTIWSSLWWHVTPEIIFVIVYLLGTSRTKLGDADTSPTYR